MTVYDPNPTVTIAGVDWRSNILEQITITAGRTSVDEQPRAGYCTIRLVNYTGIPPTLKLNDPVQVNVDNSAGVDPRLFAGYITDIQRRIVANGTRGHVNEVIVTAVGPLARLARFGTAATYPKQYDGDRIAAILTDAYTTSWDEVLSSLTWATTDPALTWLNYDPGYVGTVDTPGDFKMVAYSGGIASAASLCQEVAKSALGVLYETPDGYINYDSATARVDRAALGLLELDANYATAIGMETASNVGELINDLVVVYKNGAKVSDDDPDSIAIYGKFAAKLTTLLESGTAAQQQLDHYLATRSLERLNVGAISVPLHNPDLPDATRDALLGVFCGTPVYIPGFPTELLATGFTGFVEGYRWDITRKTATLTMNVSDYGLTAIEQAWLQVNPAETWNTVNATLRWPDAKVIS